MARLPAEGQRLGNDGAGVVVLSRRRGHQVAGLSRASNEAQNGNASSDETRFDYPQNGPADVHDLGVPKTAKLVDRVPTGDLKRILDVLKTGRERMDDYRAVCVDLSEPDDYAWWAAFPIMMYRKGDKLRADYTTGWIGDQESFNPVARENRRSRPLLANG